MNRSSLLGAAALGFETDRVMTTTVYGNFSKYQTRESAVAFYDDVLSRLRAVPGVTDVAVTNSRPLSTTTPGERRFKRRTSRVGFSGTGSP